jgi:hypothetical protein
VSASNTNPFLARTFARSLGLEDTSSISKVVLFMLNVKDIERKCKVVGYRSLWVSYFQLLIAPTTSKG